MAAMSCSAGSWPAAGPTAARSEAVTREGVRVSLLTKNGTA